ncbi:hypothetical protein PFISCL1PPCAC_28678, partial [Pristionchus fissidentatus]
RCHNRSAVPEVLCFSHRSTHPTLQMSALWSVDRQHEGPSMHDCIMMHNERVPCGGAVGGLTSSPRYSFSLADFGASSSSHSSSKDSFLAFNPISVIGTSPCSSSSFLSKMDSTSSSSSSVSSPVGDSTGPVKFFIGTHPKC